MYTKTYILIHVNIVLIQHDIIFINDNNKYLKNIQNIDCN